jgi:hypothetical protein
MLNIKENLAKSQGKRQVFDLSWLNYYISLKRYNVILIGTKQKRQPLS